MENQEQNILEPNTVAEALKPLMELPVLRVVIHFRATETWRAFGVEPFLRGQIGSGLLNSVCAYPNPSSGLCPRCRFAGQCPYINLFSPTSAGRPMQSQLPAFVIAVDSDAGTDILNAGESGRAVLTLFGPAIGDSQPMVKAAVRGLLSCSLEVTDVTTDDPPGSGEVMDADNPNVPPRPLAEWASFPEDASPDTVWIRCVTPLRIYPKGRSTGSELLFLDLIQAVIRRLRDLKRAFSMDGNMASIPARLFEAAKTVRIAENGLQWTRRERYSERQKEKLFLNGYQGIIGYQGQMNLFRPLLRAGEIVHVGKSTSNGNGRYRVINMEGGR